MNTVLDVHVYGTQLFDLSVLLYNRTQSISPRDYSK